MKKRIRLTENDIRHMVMEALSEISADAKRLADYAESESDKAKQEGDIGKAIHRGKQALSFRDYDKDRKEHPNRPIAKTPANFQWSSDKNQPQKQQSSIEVVKQNRAIRNILQQNKSIPELLDAWVNSVKNIKYGSEYDKSGLAELDNDDWASFDDENSNEVDSYVDNSATKQENEVSLSQEEYKTPEYWALEMVCEENPNSLFLEHDLLKVRNMVYSNLKGSMSYITPEQFNKLQSKDERDSYMPLYKRDKKTVRGYSKTISDGDYNILPDNEKWLWVRSKHYPGKYHSVQPKYLGNGSMPNISIDTDNIREYLPEIISAYFDNGYLIKYYTAISKSSNKYNSMKFGLCQFASQYCTAKLKDVFLQNEDSTNDGGSEENGFGKIPTELTNTNNFVNRKAEEALNSIKELFGFFANTDWNSDFYTKGSYYPKLAVFIMDHFYEIFTKDVVIKYGDLIDRYGNDVNDDEKDDNNSNTSPFMYIKKCVVKFVVDYYIQSVEDNPNNVLKRHKQNDTPIGGTSEEDLNLATIALCIRPMFTNENDHFVFTGDINKAYEAMYEKLAKFWTLLGNAKENGRGIELQKRFYDFKHGKKAPMQTGPNKDSLSETRIRNIVNETIKHWLKNL